MLRVIAGKYRSRLLDAPEEGTVPTKNRTREGMMNALNPLFPGSSCLDLFAGSGALGIEALSRGAASAAFVDSSPRACSIIEGNLRKLGEEKGEVLPMRAEDALPYLAKRGSSFDVIFLDPPYKERGIYEEAVSQIDSLSLLKEGGAIALEFEGEVPGEFPAFPKKKLYSYGRSKVLILRRE